jgi:hypothetical protein
MKVLTTLALAVAALVAGCDRGDIQSADGASEAAGQVVVLESDLTELRRDFNAAQGDARLVFIAGPSCPGCLRGLADMQVVLGDMLQQNERLHVFVVFVPTLSAEEQHARQAVRVLQGERVRHYWDPSGVSGHGFQEALGIDEYAWDVWLTYSPDAVWTEQAPPPAPRSWMHQLWNLPRDNFLDREAFAADVRELVGALS